MSGRATGDDSGLIDLDSIMKGAASEPAPSAPALAREASPPASTPQPRPRAEDSLAVAAVTTDRPPPSVASVPSRRPAPARPSTPPAPGLTPIMKPIPATAERSLSGRSTLRTAVVVVAAGLLLAGGTIGVARMRAAHAPSVAAAPPHDPPRDRGGEPSSQPQSNAQAPALANTSEPNEPATPVGALGQVSSAGTSARARVAPSANPHAPAPAAAANAELHTSDLPTSPGGGSLDLGGAMKSAVNAADDVAATTGDPSGAAKARTVRPSPGAVLGALNAVLPAARACLSPDEAMRSGTVVFASSGAVSRVDLAGNKASDGCIRDAISRARIEPFADDSFTTRITIRP